MVDIKNNTVLKAIVDTAKEIKSGGESVHQIVGELSISIERIAKIHNSKEDWTKEDVSKLIDRMFIEGKQLLKQIYENQEKTRSFILKIVVIIAITTVVAVLINKFELSSAPFVAHSFSKRPGLEI